MFFVDSWIHSQAALLHCQSYSISLSFLSSLNIIQDRDALPSQIKPEKQKWSGPVHIYHCTWLLVIRAISEEFFAGMSFRYSAYVLFDVTYSASCHRYLDKLVGSDTAGDVAECRLHTSLLLLIVQFTSGWLLHRPTGWPMACCGNFRAKSKKSKAVPLEAWSGPEGSKLRFPYYMMTAQYGCKVTPTHLPPLPPGNTPGTHFC